MLASEFALCHATFDLRFYTPVSGKLNNWLVNILLETTSHTEHFQTNLVKERKRDFQKGPRTLQGMNVHVRRAAKRSVAL